MLSCNGGMTDTRVVIVLKSITILFPCRLISARYQNLDKVLGIDLLVTRNLTDGFVTLPVSNSDYKKVTLEVFTNFPQHKNANIAKFVLAVPLERNWINDICNLEI